MLLVVPEERRVLVLMVLLPAPVARRVVPVEVPTPVERDEREGVPKLPGRAAPVPRRLLPRLVRRPMVLVPVEVPVP